MTEKRTEAKAEPTNQSAVARLQEAAAKYKTIFDKAPVSIVVTEIDGRIVDINDYHLTRIARGRLPKASFLGKVIWQHPSVLSAGMSDAYRRVHLGEEFESRKVHIPETTGGQPAYLNVRGVPLSAHGEIVGAIFIHEDVTDLVEAEAALQRAIAEVKVLRGILPVCSFCKRIRDDAGSWKSMEVYVEARSEARLSHSVCPECVRIHYGELTPSDDPSSD